MVSGDSSGEAKCFVVKDGVVDAVEEEGAVGNMVSVDVEKRNEIV